MVQFGQWNRFGNQNRVVSRSGGSGGSTLPVSRAATTSGVDYAGGEAAIFTTDTAAFLLGGLDETQSW